MRDVMKYAMMCVMAIVVWQSAMAQSRQRTTRYRIVAECAGVSLPADTSVVTDSVAYLTLSGYDKPLRASHEVLFVSNATGRDVVSVCLDVVYEDMQGRQLHRRRCDVPADVPAGETRQIIMPTWDRQRSFYYKGSTRPKRTEATAYEVRCSVVSYAVKNQIED